MVIVTKYIWTRTNETYTKSPKIYYNLITALELCFVFSYDLLKSNFRKEIEGFSCLILSKAKNNHCMFMLHFKYTPKFFCCSTILNSCAKFFQLLYCAKLQILWIIMQMTIHIIISLKYE